jgi:hypothetical protein
MGDIIIRRAEPDDAQGIARVCAAGWRDTYHGIYEPERIEAAIAEYYTPERITGEITAPHDWDGWIVAVDDGTVVGAGGGGMIESGVGEVFVLYLRAGYQHRDREKAYGAHPAPARREQPHRSCRAVPDRQRQDQPARDDVDGNARRTQGRMIPTYLRVVVTRRQRPG